MALPTATYQTYNQIGIREDLEDVIYMISPMETYFFSNAARTTAKQTKHEWQTDQLDTPSATNAYAEGEDFSAQAVNPTSRLGNICQISRKDFVVSRTANRVRTAGRAKELAYQIVMKGRSLKRDIESAATQNKAATVAASGTSRVSASVETWIYGSNHVQATGQTTASTAAPTGGLASTAGVDGTATAFAEADLKNCLQQAWSTGGDTDVILMSATLKKEFDAFTGVATRFRNVEDSSQAQIIGAADVYVSSYGSHKAVLSRYMRASVVLCLDMSTWSLAWLDPIHMENIAKSGDSEKRMLVGEWTVVARSPTANTKLTGLT